MDGQVCGLDLQACLARLDARGLEGAELDREAIVELLLAGEQGHLQASLKQTSED